MKRKIECSNGKADANHTGRNQNETYFHFLRKRTNSIHRVIATMIVWSDHIVEYFFLCVDVSLSLPLHNHSPFPHMKPEIIISLKSERLGFDRNEQKQCSKNYQLFDHSHTHTPLAMDSSRAIFNFICTDSSRRVPNISNSPVYA